MPGKTIPHHSAQGFTPVDHLGLRLARTYQVFKREMLEGLHAVGYTDILATHLLILPLVRVDGTPTSEIVERLGMMKQTVSRALRELETLGYVELATDPSDGRAKIVKPTERAVELARASVPIKQAFHAKASMAVGGKEMGGLLNSLEAIERVFKG